MPHNIYKVLGKSNQQRFVAYKELFQTTLGRSTMEKISSAWITGTPLGNDYFRQMVEEILMTRVGQDRRGRPRKGL